jgi:hypothetical protein
MSTPEAPLPVTIDLAAAVRRVFVIMVSVELGLAITDFLFAYLDVVPEELIQHLANLAREDGVGTWVSSTQAFCVGATLLGVGLAERANGRTPGGWWFLAGLFTYIALDDGLEVHERMSSAVRRMTDTAAFDAFPTYGWHLLYGPVLGASGLYMLWFLWRRLDVALRPRIALAVACFVVAVGIDFVEGLDGVFDAFAEALGVRDYTVSHGFKVTEELLEIFGTTVFWTTFLAQLGVALDGRPVTVVRDGPTVR